MERFNGANRSRMAPLTGKCRHAAYRLVALEPAGILLGSTYNFCWPHQELSRIAPDKEPCRQFWVACTPASGLVEHARSLVELMSYRVVPPPWCTSKRRGRPHKALPNPLALKRPWASARWPPVRSPLSGVLPARMVVVQN